MRSTTFDHGYVSNSASNVGYYSEDQVAMIASRVLVEADADEDGFLSFAEFEQATMNLDVEKEMSFLSLES